MNKHGRKILIVDDELLIRKVLRRCLSRVGYDTFEAGGLGTALRLFREEQPFHALLCDVYLGTDNGWRLARQIHADQPSIRIVLMSGAIVRPPVTPFDYTMLFKPFSPEELRDALEGKVGDEKARPDD